MQLPHIQVKEINVTKPSARDKIIYTLPSLNIETVAKMNPGQAAHLRKEVEVGAAVVVDARLSQRQGVAYLPSIF
jgi:hypothetical protein